MKAFLGVTLAFFVASVVSAAETRRPNIILFLIDDQDKDGIGAFGGKTRTPTLDRMARFQWEPKTAANAKKSTAAQKTQSDSDSP